MHKTVKSKTKIFKTLLMRTVLASYFSAIILYCDSQVPIFRQRLHKDDSLNGIHIVVMDIRCILSFILKNKCFIVIL